MIKRNSFKEFQKRLKECISKYNYLSSHERTETSWLWCCCPQCHITRILPLDYEQGWLLGGGLSCHTRPITRKLVLNISVRKTDENSQHKVGPGILFVLPSWEEQEPVKLAKIRLLSLTILMLWLLTSHTRDRAQRVVLHRYPLCKTGSDSHWDYSHPAALQHSACLPSQGCPALGQLGANCHNKLFCHLL